MKPTRFHQNSQQYLNLITVYKWFWMSTCLSRIWILLAHRHVFLIRVPLLFGCPSHVGSYRFPTAELRLGMCVPSLQTTWGASLVQIMKYRLGRGRSTQRFGTCFFKCVQPWKLRKWDCWSPMCPDVVILLFLIACFDWFRCFNLTVEKVIPRVFSNHERTKISSIYNS